MYNNIGKKIKVLVIVLCILECIGAFVTGIIFVSDSSDEEIGVIIMIAGPIFAWISSWFLYGYGEIIDKLQDIANNTGSKMPGAPYGNTYVPQNPYAANAYQQRPPAAPQQNPYAAGGYQQRPAAPAVPQQNPYAAGGYQQRPAAAAAPQQNPYAANAYQQSPAAAAAPQQNSYAANAYQQRPAAPAAPQQNTSYTAPAATTATTIATASATTATTVATATAPKVNEVPAAQKVYSNLDNAIMTKSCPNCGKDLPTDGDTELETCPGCGAKLD